MRLADLARHYPVVSVTGPRQSGKTTLCRATFPDLPRRDRGGWGQVPGRAQLQFCDSGSPDTFFYAPTQYRLGYHFASSAETAGRPPMRVELYRHSDGQDRIKVILVALPFIEDAEREKLRTHLRDNVLQGLQPFIFLEPHASLAATFTPDFFSGSATSPQTLPSAIEVKSVEESANERLVLAFDMPAPAYSIFGALLKKGIFGKVTLKAPGMQVNVDLQLRIDNLVTNSARFELGGTGELDSTGWTPQGSHGQGGDTDGASGGIEEGSHPSIIAGWPGPPDEAMYSDRPILSATTLWFLSVTTVRRPDNDPATQR